MINKKIVKHDGNNKRISYNPFQLINDNQLTILNRAEFAQAQFIMACFKN